MERKNRIASGRQASASSKLRPAPEKLASADSLVDSSKEVASKRKRSSNKKEGSAVSHNSAVTRGKATRDASVARGASFTRGASTATHASSASAEVTAYKAAPGVNDQDQDDLNVEREIGYLDSLLAYENSLGDIPVDEDWSWANDLGLDPEQEVRLATVLAASSQPFAIAYTTQRAEALRRQKLGKSGQHQFTKFVHTDDISTTNSRASDHSMRSVKSHISATRPVRTQSSGPMTAPQYPYKTSTAQTRVQANGSSVNLASNIAGGATRAYQPSAHNTNDAQVSNVSQYARASSVMSMDSAITHGTKSSAAEQMSSNSADGTVAYGQSAARTQSSVNHPSPVYTESQADMMGARAANHPYPSDARYTSGQALTNSGKATPNSQALTQFSSQVQSAVPASGQAQSQSLVQTKMRPQMSQVAQIGEEQFNPNQAAPSQLVSGANGSGFRVNSGATLSAWNPSPWATPQNTLPGETSSAFKEDIPQLQTIAQSLAESLGEEFVQSITNSNNVVGGQNSFFMPQPVSGDEPRVSRGTQGTLNSAVALETHEGNSIAAQSVAHARAGQTAASIPTSTMQTPGQMVSGSVQIKKQPQLPIQAQTQPQAHAMANAVVNPIINAHPPMSVMSDSDAQQGASAMLQARLEGQVPSYMATSVTQFDNKIQSQVQPPISDLAQGQAQSQAKIQVASSTQSQVLSPSQIQGQAYTKEQAQAQAPVQAKAQTQEQSWEQAQPQSKRRGRAQASQQAREVGIGQAWLQEGSPVSGQASLFGDMDYVTQSGSLDLVEPHIFNPDEIALATQQPLRNQESEKEPKDGEVDSGSASVQMSFTSNKPLGDRPAAPAKNLEATAPSQYAEPLENDLADSSDIVVPENLELRQLLNQDFPQITSSEQFKQVIFSCVKSLPCAFEKVTERPYQKYCLFIDKESNHFTVSLCFNGKNAISRIYSSGKSYAAQCCVKALKALQGLTIAKQLSFGSLNRATPDNTTPPQVVNAHMLVQTQEQVEQIVSNFLAAQAVKNHEAQFKTATATSGVHERPSFGADNGECGPVGQTLLFESSSQVKLNGGAGNGKNQAHATNSANEANASGLSVQPVISGSSVNANALGQGSSRGGVQTEALAFAQVPFKMPVQSQAVQFGQTGQLGQVQPQLQAVGQVQIGQYQSGQCFASQQMGKVQNIQGQAVVPMPAGTTQATLASDTVSTAATAPFSQVPSPFSFEEDDDDDGECPKCEVDENDEELLNYKPPAIAFADVIHNLSEQLDLTMLQITDKRYQKQCLLRNQFGDILKILVFYKANGVISKVRCAGDSRLSEIFTDALIAKHLVTGEDGTCMIV